MDRYYPRERDSVPHPVEWFDSTYQVAMSRKVNERCPYPPGYAGHMHCAKDKFGYGSVPPTAVPVPPHRQNISFARYPSNADPKRYSINLKASKFEPRDRTPTNSTLRNTLRTRSFNVVEDLSQLHFVSSNSKKEYGARGCTSVEKERPYTPCRSSSRGTGFDLCRPTTPWISTAKLASSTTVTAFHTGMQPAMRGMQCLQAQKAR